MPVKSSGIISIQDLVNEFGGAPPHSLSQFYRGGGRVPNVSVNNNIPLSGSISITQFYSAGRIFAFSFAGGSNLNLRNLAINAGWDQSTPLQATNTGTATGNAGLTINGSFPGGVTFINNGTVNSTQGGSGTQGTHGAPGAGGAGGFGWGVRGVNGSGGGGTGGGTGGGQGGTALVVSVPVTVFNNGALIGGPGGPGGPPGLRSGGGGGGGSGGVQGGSKAEFSNNGGTGGRGFGQNVGLAQPGGVGELNAGNGGPGGGQGSPGGPGGSSQNNSQAVSTGGAGGAGASAGPTGSIGFYVFGFTNVTWGAFGTRTGIAS